MTSPAPFAGVHVLDETDIRGALCGRILADFGATVHRPVHADDDGGPADVLGVDRLEWATTKGRLADVAELDELVTAWTCKRDPDEATELLQAAGVSGMTVMGPLQQAADPHLISRNFVDELVHEEFGFEHHVANPTRMSRTELRTAPSAPCLGAHTRDILHDWLNLDEAEIGQLEASGALT